MKYEEVIIENGVLYHRHGSGVYPTLSDEKCGFVNCNGIKLSDEMKKNWEHTKQISKFLHESKSKDIYKDN